MSVFTFFKYQMQVARYIGKQDFNGAIRVLEESLSNSAEDIQALEMIALCHRWCHRNDMAITYAQKVLDYDSTNFGALLVLSEIYAEREDHDTAVKFVRLGLENYPNPLPAVPKVFLWFLRIGATIFPRLKRINEAAKRDLVDPNKDNAEWYSWAKQYITWYDSNFGNKQCSTVHL